MSLNVRGGSLSAFGAALQMGLTQSVLLASLPVLVMTTGVAYSMWSWIIGGTLFLYVLAAPWWGARIDRYGAEGVQRVTAIGTTLANLLLLVALFVPTPMVAFAFILSSRVAYALFVCGLYPSSQTALVSGVDSKRAQTVLGRLVAVNRTGQLLGPALVAVFVLTDVRWPFVALVLSGAVLSWSLWRSRKGNSDRAEVTERQSLGPAWRRGDALRAVWPALLVAFSLTFSVGYLQFTLGYALADRFALSAVEASRLLSQALVVASVGIFVTHLVLIPLIVPRPMLQAAVIGVCVLIGVHLLTGSFSRLDLFVAMGLLALGHGLSSPAYTAWARDRLPGATGSSVALIMAIHTLGHGLGILASGTVGPALDEPFSVLIVAAVVQVVLMVGLLVVPRLRGRSWQTPTAEI